MEMDEWKNSAWLNGKSKTIKEYCKKNNILCLDFPITEEEIEKTESIKGLPKNSVCRCNFCRNIIEDLPDWI